MLLRKRMQVKYAARESFHRSLDSILDIVLIIGIKWNQQVLFIKV